MERIESPRTDDNAIEQEIVAKGLTAPRVTPADIEANIASEHYFTAYGGAEYARITRDELKDSDALKMLTFCVLVLRNGSPSPASRHAPARRTSTPNWGARSPTPTRSRRSGR